MSCIATEITRPTFYNVECSRVDSTPISTTFTYVSSAAVSVSPAEPHIEVDVTAPCAYSFLRCNSVPQTMEVSISIWCEIGPDIWEFLQVLEGDLITIDGEYIKVLRSGV